MFKTLRTLLLGLMIATSACSSSDSDGAADLTTTESSVTETTGDEAAQSESTDESTTTETPTTESTVEETTTTTEPASVETSVAEGERVASFSSAAVSDLGVEAIGCWFHTDLAAEPLFFAGGDEAVMLIDGDYRRMDIADKAQEIPSTGISAAYDDGAYVVSFANIGEEVSDSIESTTRTATMYVNEFGSGFHFEVLDGQIWCGV